MPETAPGNFLSSAKNALGGKTRTGGSSSQWSGTRAVAEGFSLHQAPKRMRPQCASRRAREQRTPQELERRALPPRFTDSRARARDSMAAPAVTLSRRAATPRSKESNARDAADDRSNASYATRTRVRSAPMNASQLHDRKRRRPALARPGDGIALCHGAEGQDMESRSHDSAHCRGNWDPNCNFVALRQSIRTPTRVIASVSTACPTLRRAHSDRLDGGKNVFKTA